MELITTHTNADFDTLGAMLAAKKLYPKASVAFSGSLEDTLREAVKKIEIPIKVEDARDIDLSKVTKLILVDVSSTARIGRFSELLERGDVEVHIYDHHPPIKKSIANTTLNVYKNYGSTTTILTLILKEKGIALTPDEATILMAGIYEDTGSLSYPSTKREDFEAAALLLDAGANLKTVSDLITKGLSASEVFTLGSLIRSEILYTIGGVEIVVAKVSLEDYHGDVSTLAQRMMEMEATDNLILLAETTDRVHLVIRSSAESLNAGTLAKKLGGGGHRHAASATIKGMTLIEAREVVLKALKEVIIPKTTALDIMSSPPITTTTTTTIESALELMRRYNLNALPVTTKKKPVGVITRQVLDKAVHHGLKNESVGELMSHDALTISASTSTEDIRDTVMAHGQRILTVIDDDNGYLLGVITRTDLLKLLQEGLKERDTTTGKDKKIARRKKLTSFMKERLPAWTLKILKDIGEASHSLDFRAYAVGGFVRDILLMLEDNEQNKINPEDFDIDIVIEGDGVKFAEYFAKKHSLHVKSHLRFKTSTVKFPDGFKTKGFKPEGFKIDIATARLEYYDSPGALPNVEHSSLKLDLYRRDFTINTLAMALNPDEFGELIDFFDAVNDIKEKKIRVLHNLSFIEDPIRALRALRFSERFDFNISPHTLKLIKNSIRLGLLKKSSGPRILSELKNILQEEDSEAIVERLDKLGILKLIDPSITLKAKNKKTFKAAKDAIAWYELTCIEDKFSAWLTLFLAMTDPLTDKELKDTVKRLGLTGKGRLNAIRLRKEALKALGTLERLLEGKNALTGSNTYKLFKRFPVELMLYLMATATEKKVKKGIVRYLSELKDTRPILTGSALKALGVKEGPEMGKVINGLLKGRLDGRLDTKAAEVNFVKKQLKR